tara:strand:- start:126 stop:500 length:375 start_codon:yes stop_codon:yes gene_type:complete
MTTSTPNNLPQSNKVTSLPVFDFSDDKPATEEYKEQIAEKDILKDAIAKAEAALAAKSAKRPLVKSKASKLPSTKRGKAGRIVGISKEENELLQNLLSKISDDTNYAMIVENAAFDKLVARYNK